MVKFKIAFTIDAKTLFAYLSQALPTLENLHVEEIIEQPIQRIIEKKINAPEKIADKTKQKDKPKLHRKFNLNQGLNQVIMSILSDGQPHNASEIEKAISTTMYSAYSTGSRLSSLKSYGVLTQPELGKWQLTEKYQKEIIQKSSA
jgi:hypothetical protein